jgi:hypothetical protein
MSEQLLTEDEYSRIWIPPAVAQGRQVLVVPLEQKERRHRRDLMHRSGPAVSVSASRPVSGEQPVWEKIMRKRLAILGAAALALSAAAASADEVTGTISNIDLNGNTFQVEGKTFTASPTNTVGAKLSELKEGDRVTVEATDIASGKQPINAMMIKKAE